MAESSAMWQGSTVGDAVTYGAPYCPDEVARYQRGESFLYDRSTEGVIYSLEAAYNGQLACSNPAAIQISVATGRAIVNGFIYENTAAVTLNPASGNGFYRVVIQRTYATQTTILALIYSAIGTPAVTQAELGVWEIALANFEIAAGAITVAGVVDERHFAGETFYAQAVSADNDTIADVVTIGRTLNTGGAADGFGAMVQFRLPDSAGAEQDAGGVALVWQDSAAASENSQFEIHTEYVANDVLSGVIVAPNNASARGNTRGEGATDLQGYRTAVGQVASGVGAVIGGGGANTSSNTYSTVGGGFTNAASGGYATVAGGDTGTASGNYATISGGEDNDATAEYATVGGGNSNVASGLYSTIAGGNNGTADDDYTTIGGGHDNTSTGDYTTVAGGQHNTASATNSTIGGGTTNATNGESSTVAGGASNTASDAYDTIGGGSTNVASGTYSVIGGGDHNTISAGADRGTIGGGYYNTVSETTATVVGGGRGVASIYGQCVHANGRFAADGDAQGTLQLVLRCTTAGNGVATRLYLDGVGASENIVIPASSAWTYDILVVAMRANAADVHSSRSYGALYRDNGGSTVLSTTSGVIVERAGGGTTTIAADDFTESLNVQFTDDGANIYRAVAIVRLAQVTFAA